MRKLNDMPQVVDKCLAGLNADDSMKLKIEKAASSGETERTALHWKKAWVVCCSCAAAAVVALAVALPAGITRLSQDKVLNVNAAGGKQQTSTQAPDADWTFAEESNVYGEGKGRITAANHFAIKSTGSTPAYHSIWSKNVGSSAPLIRVDGKFYRMMSSPNSVSSDVLGASLGTVEEFAEEPAVSATKCIMSNVAQTGTEVYAVSGMENTLIAADVDGTTRAFQRTSFSGNALLGSEGISDVLEISGHISAMELSEVGIVEDDSTCEDLFSTLTSNASYEGTGSVKGSQSLIIELDNGLAVQLAVKGDSFSGCGKWNCPEFFRKYKECMGN